MYCKPGQTERAVERSRWEKDVKMMQEVIFSVKDKKY